MLRLFRVLVIAIAAVSAATVAIPAHAADSPRELLVSAAFGTRDKATALARIDSALRGAEATLARRPADREAQLQRALAISYRGKLNRNRGDLIVARKVFEALVAAQPGDPESLMALAGWNLGAIIELGPMMARAGLGARKGWGLKALDRAVALGAGRPIFSAFASFTRIQLDAADVAEARRLAEMAVAAAATTPVDRIMQRQAAALLPLLRAGNGKAAARSAGLLLPFGRLQ
jgi:hypothetical protein